MSYVVILKTAKDIGLAGAPEDFPVLCAEFLSFGQAKLKYPDKVVYSCSQYRELKKSFDLKYQAPKPPAVSGLFVDPQPPTKRWWQFWKWFS